ncbi:MAG: antibiotic biosynthesis monooxygenase family protein [Gemmobacter sp.]
MHGVFFDMRARPGHMPHYFDHVARLRPHLDRHPGLVFLERFRPMDDAAAILSHQRWSGEDALRAWRADAAHRASQAAGRHAHFEQYRIRVGPEIDLMADEPVAAPARLVVAAQGNAPARDGRAYESITRPGRFLTLADAHDAPAALGLAARARAAGCDDVRVFAIRRDYGMTDRAEAPR